VARHSYFVYILTNQAGTLYVGVTNNLERRVIEHKQGALGSFTKRYKISRLVYTKKRVTLRLPLPERSRSRAGCGAGRSS
jgi:putative endonuclease